MMRAGPGFVALVVLFVLGACGSAQAPIGVSPQGCRVDDLVDQPTPLGQIADSTGLADAIEQLAFPDSGLIIARLVSDSTGKPFEIQILSNQLPVADHGAWRDAVRPHLLPPAPGPGVPNVFSIQLQRWDARLPTLLQWANLCVPVMSNRQEYQRALMREYPPRLRNAGVGGSVLVRLSLDGAGTPLDARIVESSGQVELDEVAMRLAPGLRFQPARIEGLGFPVHVQFSMAFRAGHESRGGG